MLERWCSDVCRRTQLSNKEVLYQALALCVFFLLFYTLTVENCVQFEGIYRNTSDTICSDDLFISLKQLSLLSMQPMTELDYHVNEGLFM